MPFAALRLILLSAISVLTVACSKRQVIDLDSPAKAQQAYFPLHIGKSLEYAIDSIIYDFGPGGVQIRDTITSFCREYIADTFPDNNGDIQYRIERYVKYRENDAWTISGVFTASLHAEQAIRTEQNLRFLKMVFPMNRRSEWDGNLWIDKDREIEIAGERMRPFSNWAYEVDSIDVPATIGAFSFDSTLLITEADDVNIIERRFSRARYAKNIGLVWKEQWILDSQYCNQVPPPSDCETLPWDQKAEKGYILRQRILRFN